MKILLVVTVSLAVFLQLSLADDSVKAIVPPTDKLYPIFELVANKMHEYSKKEISILGSIYGQIFEEYSTYIKSHNTKPYQDFKEEIEKFINAVELLVKDPENCDLLRAAFKQLTVVSLSKPDDNELKAIINKAYNSTVYKQEYKTLVHGFTAQFPEVIKSFVEGLDETEKEKYADLYKFGQELVNATDDDTKFRAFQNFTNKIKFTENTTSANSENCKWDVKMFKSFEDHIKAYVFIDLDKINF